MKIFSVQQMRRADEATLKAQQITSLELMERASTQIFNLIHSRLQGSQTLIHVFCGLGNNGGDGLVLARLLLEHGYAVKTYIVNFSENRSNEFLVNYDRLKEISKEWPTQLKSEDNFPDIRQEDMVIDAIFGIGLNRSIVPWVGSLLKHINQSRGFVLSIDIPSGLYLDKAPENKEEVIFANVTVTFQLPKLVFFLPETGIYSQDIEVIDIGLDQRFLMEEKGIASLISKREVLPLYKTRYKFSHKGDFGHCAIIGGSYGKIGSVVLATKSALKTGAGLTTAIIPECGYEVLQSSVPEAMVITDDEDDELIEINLNFQPSSIGIGVGMGTGVKTVKAFEAFLQPNEVPLVIDADAINILSKHPEFLAYIKPQTIFTPHPKELSRLIGEWKDDFDKLEKTKEFSKQYDVIVVIKGANTIIIYQDQMYINTSGNPGMASAGSGDVLTGVITGLLSQKYEPLHAAVFGVYLHGSAGDIAVQSNGFEGTIASDLVANIGSAFLELFKRPNTLQEPQNG